MSQTEKYYDNLKEAVEKIAGRLLYSHSDYTELSESIYQKTKTIISPTTLKRFWGYLKNESPNPQIRTLNVLAVFAGHHNWEDFCNHLDNQDDYSSEYVTRNKMYSFLMQKLMSSIFIYLLLSTKLFRFANVELIISSSKTK